jgi:hypothetical protein
MTSYHPLSYKDMGAKICPIAVSETFHSKSKLRYPMRLPCLILIIALGIGREPHRDPYCPISLGN